jgi:hypothetical protein
MPARTHAKPTVTLESGNLNYLDYITSVYREQSSIVTLLLPSVGAPLSR